jgi:hypothetical protein
MEAACANDVSSLRARRHPEWYIGSGLTPQSDRRAAQAWMFHLGAGNGPGPPGAPHAPLVFPAVNRFCVALLCE